MKLKGSFKLSYGGASGLVRSIRLQLAEKSITMEVVVNVDNARKLEYEIHQGALQPE